MVIKMSQKEKLLQRLLQRPKDFEYSEIVKLLRCFGYNEDTAPNGSRVRFISKNNSVITFHKPHPQPTLKRYVLDIVIDTLRKDGLIQ